MKETEIEFDYQELKGSYDDARKMLAVALGSNKSYDLDEIIKLLKDKDKGLAKNEIEDEEKKNILEAIWKYKVLCNMNDAENRIANTLNLFIKDIYKDSFHFFLELIQNADDASKGGDKNCLKITLDKEYNIIFEYDERGFNFSDIFSLTSLGNSTKKAQLDDNSDIGEKGIGFKSIFAIVKEIDIKSKYFSFSVKADINKLTTILEPSKITLDTSLNTILTLTLKDELKTGDFFNQVHEWMESNLMCKDAANPFLFLKNIRGISYLNENISCEEKKVEIQKTQIDDNFIYARINEMGYVIYTENMTFSKQAIVSRWKYLENDLNSKPDDFTITRPTQVAFPLIENNIPKGKIYSYLPTTIELGIPIFVNLDIHLTASRGNITKDDFATESVWNNQVEENLSQFLSNAYLKLIETHTNKLKDDEHLKSLRETLYRYVPTNDQNGSYANKFNDFKDKINEEAIILTNEDTFAKLDEIRYISSSLKGKEYDESRLQALYQFIDSNRMESLFPKDIEWNKLVYYIGKKPSNCYNAYDFVKAQNGIKRYWDNQREVNVLVTVIEMLKEDISKFANDKDIKIIPLDSKEKKSGFELASYNSIEQAIFLHSSNEEIDEDHENSVYIYDGEKKIKGLKELVSVTYKIEQYNLTNYFQKKTEEFGTEIKEEGIKNFIDCTFRFYKTNPNCFNIKESPTEIKNFFRLYTLSGEDWDLYEDEKENQVEEINKTYVHMLASLDKLYKWVIPQEVNNKSQYINYLMFLGIKHKIEFVDNNIDNISVEVLEKNKEEWTDKEILINKTNRQLQVEEGSLQSYFLEELNANVNKISKEKLRDLCGVLGLFKIYSSGDNKYYVKEDKHIFILEQEKIDKLQQEIKKFSDMNKQTHFIGYSSFNIISKKAYSEIWKKLAKTTEFMGVLTTENWNEIEYTEKATVQNKFMNSFYKDSANREDDTFLKDLRMFRILNKIFDLNYAWGHDKNSEAKPLSCEQFLSCYKELSGDEKLGDLMKAGYKVDLDDRQTAKSYLDKYKDLEEFLSSIEISQKKTLKDEIDLSLFAIIESNLMKEDYVIFDNENNKTQNIRYLLKDQKKHSILILNILKVKGIELRPSQKKEIEDYFGELIYTAINPQELNSVGYTPYCSGVFFDFHEQNIKKGKKQLKSIWNKEILQQLCIPFELDDHTKMEGYGYTCPICGEKSLAALSGMKFSRFKNYNSTTYPYIYIVSCINCNSMLKYAKSCEIQEFDEIMKNFQICYCVDNNHIKNHSKMMTVTMKIKTWNDSLKFLPMKVSYLNMILYDKLSK
nr:hypothetical protein [uncultured Anaerosporobacter sp.]